MRRTKKEPGPPIRSERVCRDCGQPAGRCRCRRKAEETVDLRAGQEVDLVILGRSDLGYRAEIASGGEGMLYRNEVFRELKKGQEIKGFIKKVREDGKVDLCLQRPGYRGVDDVSRAILEAIGQRGGFIPVTDDSSPREIRELFGVSKKTFKKAVGALYKKRMVVLEEGGIRMTGRKQAPAGRRKGDERKRR